MKFNEKLIKLRKENGMSQEQLGFELNVTRQTVSKWELGISTPEMDKLVELSKLFGVSVDELISDNTTQSSNGNYQTNNNEYVGVDSKYIPKDDGYNPEKEQEKIKKEETLNKGKKIAKKIGGAYLVYLIIMFVFVITVFVIIGVTMFKRMGNFSEISKRVENQFENVQQTNDKINESNQKNQIEIESYNKGFEILGGSDTQGIAVDSLINNIILNNNNNDNKISVNYNGKELKENDDIQNIEVDKFSKYNVSFKYNKNGYINKVEIEIK